MDIRERLARLSPAQRARLAARLGEKLAGAGSGAAEAGVAPLTQNQVALWLRDGVLPGPAANLYVAYRIAGPLAVAALTRGLERLMGRHAMLRMVFGERDGRPAQWCVEEGLPFAVVELEGRTAEAFAVEEASRGFDLSRVVWRARLARVGPTEHVFTLCMHEIASDGRSFVVLLAELAEFYGEEVSGEAETARAAGPAFASFAERQRGLDVPRLIAAARERFAGWTPCLPVTDKPRPLLPEPAGGRVHAFIKASEVEGLVAVGRSVGATPFMTTFAVLALVLHRRMGAAAVAVPVAVDGRATDEVDTVGFYLNLVPVISRVVGSDDMRGVLAATREACLAALRVSELPLAELYPALMPAATSPRSIFPVIFAHQNMGSLALALPGLTAERLAIDNGTCSFEMAWFTAEEDGGLSVELRYDRSLYSRETAESWVADYVRVARAIAADPGRRVETLPVDSNGSVAVGPLVPVAGRSVNNGGDVSGRGVFAYLTALVGPFVPEMAREQLLELLTAMSAGGEGLGRLLRVVVRLLGPLFGEEAAMTGWDLEMARHIGRILAAHLGVAAPPLPREVPWTEAEILAWLRPFAVWAGQLAPDGDLRELLARVVRRGIC